MRLLLWGIDHRSAAVQLREKIALTGDRLEAFRRQLQAAYPQVECVVLSTCNRTEIYLARPTHEPPDFQQVTELVASITGATCEDMQAAVVQREKEEVITHLFGVASGLDSMVLGEVQVLGQVRRAYTDEPMRDGRPDASPGVSTGDCHCEKRFATKPGLIVAADRSGRWQWILHDRCSMVFPTKPCWPSGPGKWPNSLWCICVI
ncbi:MAG: hypothetical protein HC898_05535 [Phycisphaerales bacterium]|nr:hypothetical protein [Phycisphaerales bacterium]